MKVTYALQKDMLYPDLEKDLEKDDNWSRVNVSKSPPKLMTSVVLTRKYYTR